MSAFYSWFVSGLVLAALEFVVPGFVIIFFGAGAILTAFAMLAFPGMSANTQAILFVALSLVSLAAFRRQAFGHGAKKSADANKDYDDDFIGREAVVVEPISPGVPGKVELNGVNWNAVSESTLSSGSRVRIAARDGLTLKVG